MYQMVQSHHKPPRTVKMAKFSLIVIGAHAQSCSSIFLYLAPGVAWLKPLPRTLCISMFYNKKKPGDQYTTCYASVYADVEEYISK